MADHSKEILTDNTKIQYCAQCYGCKHWGNDPKDPWTKRPDKASCDKFRYPEHKPVGVVDNYENCEFFAPRERKIDE